MNEWWSNALRPKWGSARRWLARRRWRIVLALWIFAFILGFVGLMDYRPQGSEDAAFSPWWTAYASLQLFCFRFGHRIYHGHWAFEVARFMAPAIVVYAAGRGLTLVFYRQWQYVRAWRVKNHVLVCGMSNKGVLLAETMLRQGKKVVVIERTGGGDMTAQPRVEGAVILQGDATSSETLRQARVHKASHVVAVCGSDSVNAEVAAQVRRVFDTGKGLGRSKAGHCVCLAHISDPLLTTKMNEMALSLSVPDHFAVRFFNLMNEASWALLREFPPFGLLPDAGPDKPNVLIVGAGDMGSPLLRRLAERWGVRVGLNPEREQPLLSVTVFDDCAERTLQDLRGRSMPWAAPKTTPGVDRLLSASAKKLSDFNLDSATKDGAQPYTICYVMHDLEGKALSLALDVQRGLRQRRETPPADASLRDQPGHAAAPDQTPLLVVRTRTGAGFTSVLETLGNPDSKRQIRPFPVCERTLGNPDFLLRGLTNPLARSIHECWARMYGVTEPIPWGQEWADQSSRYQALWLPEILSAFGYLIRRRGLGEIGQAGVELDRQVIDDMARLEHNRWCAERVLSGWTFGKKRVVAMRLHPDLKPWTQLDGAAQDKNHEFVRQWPKLLWDLGYVVEKNA